MDTLILLTFCFVCSLSDLRTHRIPNTLILCGLAGALLSRLFSVFVPLFTSFPPPVHLSGALFWNMLVQTADGCAGALLPWLLFGVLASLRMFGGGDVKLLSVIGLQLGLRECLAVMWYSLLFSAVWSVILVIRRRNLIQRLAYLYQYIGKLMITRQPVPYRRRDENHSGEFCFAPLVWFALWAVLRFPSLQLL